MRVDINLECGAALCSMFAKALPQSLFRHPLWPEMRLLGGA